MRRIKAFLLLFFLSYNFLKPDKVFAFNLQKGELIFNLNCIACHNGGTNVIIPEKNLKRLTLEANGMFTKDAIMYQVLNGKNGMPAFGGRLKDIEIEDVAEYVIFAAEKNFLTYKTK
jgi:cytochrome c6